jgi:UDP-2-acetamido-2-deoxy-ribo-hexuluronate aminotransferase
MGIRTVDLTAQNREVNDRIQREFAAIHLTGQYVGGDQVSAFEEEFAAYLKVRRVVAVGSGSDALSLALTALGVGAGDEVLTVPMAFAGVVESIIRVGATPVFTDVDPVSCNIDPAAVRRYLKVGRSRTRRRPRVIIPVHLYGLPAPVGELREIAGEFGLKIIEDASEASGARVRAGRRWRMAGTLGDAGCFSFHPDANLGAWGNAGAVAGTDNDALERIELLRNHGRGSRFTHTACGFEARMDAIQAGVLRAKLTRLPVWNERRRALAKLYGDLLSGTPLTLPAQPGDAEPCCHWFVIRSRRRNAIREALLRADVETEIRYPVPLHLQPAYRFLKYRKGEFPAAESIAETALSLPLHPHLSEGDVERVARAVKSAIGA